MSPIIFPAMGDPFGTSFRSFPRILANVTGLQLFTRRLEMICSDFYRCFECFRAFVVRLVRSDLHNNTNLNFSKHCFNNEKRMFIVSIVYNKFYMLFIISKIIIIIIIRMFLISRISKIRRKSRIPYLILCNSIFLNKKYTEESNPRCLIQFLIKLKLFINSINRLN